ncbi:acetoacetate--CoA ligase [Sulfitobacter sp. M57]|uniref:acetoacetate--CoA ligase n=1 Tax=unclassified Sulfitobacter TaxID=196795 RepID=UPI0023E2E583|nr:MULTISPECIES: acetoacetate--CoA ligase [unclassified Sulfitobacter]MDF3416507.1 acetoacetate--CoA ligase [Sulfitobacter sp. KE5]MDF3423938.1 acetoacetate--CoA ligase [Sulfitobacter sp. KE43]MDF3435039.1 acetoacetate--CoA ligase [Sulfitobacter sp. KE42]MDF3460642.1 acetoacetate--CoA ligase [Sulfitobacter sp. S74]MDF3464596.1 acetoacetate--CoA ligase [Sulfitobacter sp. Ks18]
MTGKVLWTPTPERADASSMAKFEQFVGETRGLEFADYNEMWRWSVDDLEGFWNAIWDFFDLRASVRPEKLLVKRQMPEMEWGTGGCLNYAENILKHAAGREDKPAVVVQSETFGRSEMTWGQLHEQVASVAKHLRAMGVVEGDRVVAILPNTETALIALLATASIGAVWSLCAPDMGYVAILDRFKQIAPKVLIAQDGYVHGGKMVDRRDVLAKINAGLPSVAQFVTLPVVGAVPDGHVDWRDLTKDKASLEPAQVAFEHPLWIVYSSGTTGNPKPIVHGHGGIILESAKQSLHHDVTASDRYCWLTSSGWIMWNSQWMALGQGACVAMYDGAPNHPDMGVIWRFIADEKLTYFGAGAAYFSSCMKAGLTPRTDVDLSAIRSLGSTGSPLSGDTYDWIYRDVKADQWLAPISGGTDLAGAFVLGHPGMPVVAGEMQCRALGNAVRAFDALGTELTGEVGELVCTEPLPSMPLYFWGDTDGSRLRESYFEDYPGVWRHGDWIAIDETGASVIYGRSDATINRKGLRMGSAEIYQAVEGLDWVMDSLVVDLEFLGRESFMPLFVVTAEGVTLDDAGKDQINAAIRAQVSARFIPNEIIQINEVPRTLSGKKLEVPVKKLLLGGDPARVVNRDSMANPDSFDFFIAYAGARASA